MFVLKLPDLLLAKVEGDAVHIAGKYPDVNIVVLGSSLAVSAISKTHYNRMKSFTVYPLEKNREGIIALTVYAVSGRDHKGRANEVDFPVFLKLNWKSGPGNKPEPFVDLQNPWFPSERVGQVNKENIEVRIGNRCFSTEDHNEYSKVPDYSLPTYLPDGNLLCRYLFGMAKAHEVLHAVVQRKLEPSLAKRLWIAEDLRREAERRVRALEGEVEDLKTQVFNIREDVKALAVGLVRFHDIAKKLLSPLRFFSLNLRAMFERRAFEFDAELKKAGFKHGLLLNSANPSNMEGKKA